MSDRLNQTNICLPKTYQEPDSSRGWALVCCGNLRTGVEPRALCVPRRAHVAFHLSTRSLVWGEICEPSEPSNSQGRVWGLLCNQCNTGLGAFKDNIGLVYMDFVYLQNTMKP